MKPRSFEYVSATSLSDVFAALRDFDGEALILAGGQNLVPTLNMRLNEAAALIDINGLPGLDRIEVRGDHLRIGALCRHEVVRTSADVLQHAPLLSEALAHVAHPAIRNRGTFGGSICNADAAAELPACILALGASINLESSEGTRTVAAEDFFLGFFETARGESEILTSVDIPLPHAGTVHFFDEVARRRGDYALAGLAAVARVEGGAVTESRFAFISCGDRPLLARNLSELLKRVYPAMPAESEVAAALARDLDPPADMVTSASARLQIARVLAVRALHTFREAGFLS